VYQKTKGAGRMQRNLVPVKLSDQRESATNTIYVYHIDPPRALPTAEKEKYLENEDLKKRPIQLNHAVKARIESNNAAIALALKKLGIALQRIAARQNKPFSSNSVRVRFCDTNPTNNTYNIVLEHHGILEIHTDVPVPLTEENGAAIDFSKITQAKDIPVNQVVEDYDISIIAEGREKGVFTSAYAGGTILNLELPALPIVSGNDRENKFEDNAALLTPLQRKEALQLFPAHQTILAQLDAHTTYLRESNDIIEHNQAAVEALTNNIQAQVNLPDEVKALWKTVAETAATLNAELDAQNNLQATAEAQLNYSANLPTPNLKQNAERILLYNYGLHKEHEKGLLKPTESATAKALRLTALQYFKSLLSGFKVNSTGVFKDDTNLKITEFNQKFGGIAIIKTKRDSNREEPVLCFDQSLAKKNLAELAAITNDLIIACTYYQGRMTNSTALALLTTNMEERAQVKQKYTLTTMSYSEAKKLFRAKQNSLAVSPRTKPLPFQWLETISAINKEAPPDDTRLLSRDIATFNQRIQHERTQLNATTAGIQALQASVHDAIQATTATSAELARLKTAAITAATNTQKGLVKLEEEVRAIELARNAMVTTAKNRKSPELNVLTLQLKARNLGDKIENKFIKLSENLETLRQETQEINNETALIQSQNSVEEVKRLRLIQDGHISNFIAARTKITGATDSLNGFKTILDKAEMEGRQAEALEQQQQERAREAAEKIAAQEREQQRQARVAEEKAANAVLQAEQHAHEAALQLEANKQRDKNTQQLVIETAKKLAHIVSSVTYWHKQVRLWGGVNVPNPDGGTVSVPLGVSEMLKHKNTLNLAALTYDEAVRFINQLKRIAEIADQRGSWNCCYPVRKTGTTGALYNYLVDFDIQTPPQAAPSDTAFNNIFPEWKATYGVVNSQTSLLSDAPDVLHPSPTRLTA
jgi:hypothetical protein